MTWWTGAPWAAPGAWLRGDHADRARYTDMHVRFADAPLFGALIGGIRRARTGARAAAAEPEGPLALFRRLRDPDTRRGLAAALAAIGGSLPRE